MSDHSVLIIGCGSIGIRHLRCFRLTGRASVTACDTEASQRERIAREFEVETVSDWQRAVATGRHTAAVVCTPAPMHVPMALHLIEAGLDVLIEKPLSHSFENIENLIARARDSKRAVAVAYVYRAFPFLAAARNFLQEGSLGPIKQVAHISGQHFPTGRPADAVPYAQTYYRDRRTGGGAIQDALTHTANWVESVVGPTTSVLCDCAHQVLAEVDVEDTVHVSARHGDVLVSYSLNQFQAPNETTIQFNTAAGSLKIEFHRQRWGVFRFGDDTWTWYDEPVAGRDTHFISQAHAFLDLIEGKASPLCSLQEAADTVRFNLAALAAAESGARVFTSNIHD